MAILEDRFAELQRILPEFEDLSSSRITSAAQLIAAAFKNGNKLLICGNGGSAADAQHFAAEFVNSFSKKLNRIALPAISLASDSSVLTSIANDKNFESVFSRQVEALGKLGDILIAFTTSGESKNCLNAVESAKRLNLKTILFTQKDKISREISDVLIEVPSSNTQIIQECHILAYHIIVEIVESIMFTEEVLT
jgi:D-sedoheptulose 7-phosphate isomerase